MGMQEDLNFKKLRARWSLNLYMNLKIPNSGINRLCFTKKFKSLYYTGTQNLVSNYENNKVQKTPKLKYLVYNTQ